MMAKSAEARKICRDLDRLEAVGQQQGQTLVWSAQEQAIERFGSNRWKCELWRLTSPPLSLRKIGDSHAVRTVRGNPPVVPVALGG